MTAPIPAPPTRVVDAYTGYVSPNGMSTIARELREIDRLRAEVECLTEALENAREDRDMFADRAEKAERELNAVRAELDTARATGGVK